jgi:hypothetical protein
MINFYKLNIKPFLNDILSEETKTFGSNTWFQLAVCAGLADSSELFKVAINNISKESSKYNNMIEKCLIATVVGDSLDSFIYFTNNFVSVVNGFVNGIGTRIPQLNYPTNNFVSYDLNKLYPIILALPCRDIGYHLENIGLQIGFGYMCGDIEIEEPDFMDGFR